MNFWAGRMREREREVAPCCEQRDRFGLGKGKVCSLIFFYIVVECTISTWKSVERRVSFIANLAAQFRPVSIVPTWEETKKNRLGYTISLPVDFLIDYSKLQRHTQFSDAVYTYSHFSCISSTIYYILSSICLTLLREGMLFLLSIINPMSEQKGRQQLQLIIEHLYSRLLYVCNSSSISLYKYKSKIEPLFIMYATRKWD